MLVARAAAPAPLLFFYGAAIQNEKRARQRNLLPRLCCSGLQTKCRRWATEGGKAVTWLIEDPKHRPCVRDHNISPKDREHSRTFSGESTQRRKANISSLRSTARSPSVSLLESCSGSKREMSYSNVKLFGPG